MTAFIRRLFGSERPIEEHLYCPLCTHPIQEPRELSCGHTFCKKCLLDYRMQPSLLVTARPPGTDPRHTDHYCPVCSVHVDLTSPPVPTTDSWYQRAHNSLAEQRVQNSKGTSEPQYHVRCRKHGLEPGIVCTQCRVVCCKHCVGQQHAMHSERCCDLLLEVIPDLQNRLRSHRDCLLVAYNQRRQHRRQAEKAHDQHQRAMVSIEATVKRSAASLVQQIRRRETELLGELSDYHDRREKTIKDYISLVEYNLDQTARQIRLMNQLVTETGREVDTALNGDSALSRSKILLLGAGCSPDNDPTDPQCTAGALTPHQKFREVQCLRQLQTSLIFCPATARAELNLGILQEQKCSLPSVSHEESTLTDMLHGDPTIHSKSDPTCIYEGSAGDNKSNTDEEKLDKTAPKDNDNVRESTRSKDSKKESSSKDSTNQHSVHKTCYPLQNLSSNHQRSSNTLNSNTLHTHPIETPTPNSHKMHGAARHVGYELRESQDNLDTPYQPNPQDGNLDPSSVLFCPCSSSQSSHGDRDLLLVAERLKKKINVMAWDRDKQRYKSSHAIKNHETNTPGGEMIDVETMCYWPEQEVVVFSEKRNWTIGFASIDGKQFQLLQKERVPDAFGVGVLHNDTFLVTNNTKRSSSIIIIEPSQAAKIVTRLENPSRGDLTWVTVDRFQPQCAFITDAGDNTIKYYDSRSNSLVRNFGGGRLSQPAQLVQDYNGDLIVANSAKHEVVLFNMADYCFRRQMLKNERFLRSPRSLALGNHGEMAVARSDGVVKVYDAYRRHCRP